MNNINLEKYDPEIWNCIEKEKNRQEEHIELIASENYASLCVMEAQGSQLTNKYAEGYPEKRYYGGCMHIDQIEKIAIDRAKLLFHADYVNVQPHSGSQANFAVYHALLQPRDLILGMKLSHGGHLTHGALVNFSGKIYQSISYGVDNNGEIDYNQLKKLAMLHRPKIIIGGFSAYSGLCDWETMRNIADSINAYFVVDMSHIAGLISAKLYPNPLDFAHIVTSTTHKTLAGPRGGFILAKGNDIKLYKKIDSAVFPGTQGGPLMHVIAAKAVAFKEAMHSSFIKYQMQVLKNAQAMVKIFINCGYTVLGKSTYNHLFLIDLTNKKITGKEADFALSLANITINKNSVPNDLQNPFITSGIRLGTPAVTRRGLKEKHVELLAYWIVSILNDITNYNNILKIKENVINLCLKHPVYDK